MDMQTPEEMHEAFLAAERLRNEPAFQVAVTTIRKDALELCASIDPTKIDEMRDAQATVRAIDALTTNIANAILRWKATRPKE